MVLYTVSDFKAQFPRFSPMYLPEYILGNTYHMGDIVYYLDLFYRCKVTNTINEPSNTTDWEPYSDSALNYTQDSDIQNAIAEASINFNSDLFGSCDRKSLIFGYLVAHYLTVDFNNALGIGQFGITTSKSVGSVSESYTMPNWLLNNAALSPYATTGYGIKYASLLRPYLVGNVFVVKGDITLGN